ncbi:MAG: hypothetical protein ABIA59_10735 [Candidatus Latescibacterota bacterium]
MVYFFIVVFGAVSLVLIARPLFSSKKHLYCEDDYASPGNELELAYWKAKKQLLADNTGDLEFEFEMGKLSQEDYDRLSKDCAAELQTINQTLAAFDVRRDIDDLIESDVAARRKLK